MVEGGMKVIKYTIICFNVLFFMSGIAIIAVGAIAQAKLPPYNGFIDGKFWSPPIALVVVGCLILLTSFFGCCGALMESYCMTQAFAVFLGFIILLELGTGITAYVLREDLHDYVHDSMMTQLKKHYMNSEEETTTRIWDVHQMDLHCCGVDDFNDWENSNFANSSTSNKNSVPDSCCVNHIDSIGCGKDQRITPDKKIYTEGCFKKLREDIEGNILAVGGVGIGLAAMQFLGVIFACCLARTIQHQYQIV